MNAPRKANPAVPGGPRKLRLPEKSDECLAFLQREVPIPAGCQSRPYAAGFRAEIPPGPPRSKARLA
jgi:hypothetical protein